VKPEFIYFDLGNVLLSFSHERMCRQMAEAAGWDAEFVRRTLFEAENGPSLQWRFERGELDSQAVYERLCAAAATRAAMHQMFAAGCDMFAEITDSVAIVRRLHAAGERLGILSNTNPIDWAFVRSGPFPFLNECFEHAVLSFEVRAMKPERGIYEAAVARAGVAAERIFFTDDREENVAGALEAGFDAVLFTTPDKLEAELIGRGVL
jgi:HAD superfamily hydrolase (TIGR01509 family)